MSEQQPAAVHNGIVITYNELENRWFFMLRDVERSSATLALARVAIDKPVPKDKAQFKRRKAFLGESYHATTFEPVEVTSLAAKEKYSYGNSAWVVNRDGKRTKENLERLYEDTPENVMVMADIIALSEQSSQIHEKVNALRKKLVRLDTSKVEGINNQDIPV